MRGTPRTYRLDLSVHPPSWSVGLAFHSGRGCLRLRLLGLGESAMAGCIELAWDHPWQSVFWPVSGAPALPTAASRQSNRQARGAQSSEGDLVDRQDSCTQDGGLVALELPVSGLTEVGLSSSVGAGPQPVCCCVARGVVGGRECP